MGRLATKLHYSKFEWLQIVDNKQNNDKSHKNITLKELYCKPKPIKDAMGLVKVIPLYENFGVKKDFRFKKNRLKESWEINDISDALLWMQSRAFRGVVGLKVKALRSKLGISQTSFARRAGWDQGYQSRLEDGKVNLTIVNLAKIAILLNTNVKNML